MQGQTHPRTWQQRSIKKSFKDFKYANEHLSTPNKVESEGSSMEAVARDLAFKVSKSIVDISRAEL